MLKFKVCAFYALFALVFTSVVFAEDADTAYVPFIVNTAAVVKAELKDGANDVVFEYEISVEANTEKTLKIPLEKATTTTSAMHRPQNGLNNAPVIVSNHRGKVSLSLPGQIYKNAEISLYSINGKRILRTKAAASETVKSISRPNLAAGVYVLSVKSTSGNNFSNRLTHRGGSLNINAAFSGSENLLTASYMTDVSPVIEDWTITVSAEGYFDAVYLFSPIKDENPLQNVILSADGGQFNPNITYGSFIDTRGGIIRSYRTVEIGGQTWMAENLNYAGDGSNVTGMCYSNNPNVCAKYGRLYSWSEAMGIDSEYDTDVWGENDLNHQGVCPAGWHIPSDAEWTALIDFAGGESTAGTKLKSQSGWSNMSGYIPGTNDYGFSVLPGGSCQFGSCRYDGERVALWSATEHNDYDAGNLVMSNKNANVSFGEGIKMYHDYVRCVKNDYD